MVFSRSNTFIFRFSGFESRFSFHDKNEFPPPEPMARTNKTYPSKHVNKSQGRSEACWPFLRSKFV